MAGEVNNITPPRRKTRTMTPDGFFKSFLSVVVVASVPQFLAVVRCVPPRTALDPAYPRLTDLWPSVGVMIAFYLLRILWISMMRPLARRLVSPISSSDVYGISQLTVQQFSQNTFKLMYFTILILCVYPSLAKESWLPQAVGGQATGSLIELYWSDYPFQQVTSNLRWYYDVSLGYQLCMAAALVTEPPFPDFWETTLQVVLALILMTSSYMANHVRIGCLLMVIHDVCDISVNATRCLLNTRFRVSTILACIALLVSWSYLRLYIFITVVLLPIFQKLKYIYLDSALGVANAKLAATNLITARGGSQDTIPDGMEGLTVMNLLAGWFGFLVFLLSLLLLNIYWFGLILKGLYAYTRYGAVQDSYAHIDNFQQSTSRTNVETDSNGKVKPT